jgi:hypothetical protein
MAGVLEPALSELQRADRSEATAEQWLSGQWVAESDQWLSTRTWHWLVALTGCLHSSGMYMCNDGGTGIKRRVGMFICITANSVTEMMMRSNFSYNI